MNEQELKAAIAEMREMVMDGYAPDLGELMTNDFVHMAYYHLASKVLSISAALERPANNDYAGAITADAESSIYQRHFRPLIEQALADDDLTALDILEAAAVEAEYGEEGQDA